jgi:hypothetical protein
MNLPSICSLLFLSNLLLTVTAMPVYAAPDCQDLSGCENKLCQIEGEIHEAKKYDNQHKVAGLNRALQEVSNHCTDEGLKQQYTEEIDDLNEDIAEYQVDLSRAIEDNDREKTAKYQQKIAKKQAKIMALEKKRSAIK